MIKKICIAGFSLWILVVFMAAHLGSGDSVAQQLQHPWVAQLDGLLELPQVRAFLDVIAYAEGTCVFPSKQSKQPKQARLDYGYTMLYGGGSFSSYHDHPRTKLCYISNKRMLKSTAAGRYQILSRTWDAWAPVLKLRTFSPKNQDKLAIALIRECGALQDVIQGRYQKGLKKVCSIWASLPGAPYGQRVLSQAKLARLYDEQFMVYYLEYQKKYCS